MDVISANDLFQVSAFSKDFFGMLSIFVEFEELGCREYFSLMSMDVH